MPFPDERTLDRDIEALQEVDRLKRDLLDALSHEFRTPLSVVMANAEFLEDNLGGELTDEQRSFVKAIQKGAMRLEILLEDMIDVGRIEAGTLHLAWRDADLGTVVFGALDRIADMAVQAGLRLMAKLPPDPVPLRMDPDRIGRALHNLLVNAVRFTPMGGRVVVTLRPLRDGARIEVRDTGIGIPKDLHSRLFDKFFQVHTGPTRSSGGAGLGLSIAKAFVEAHGGQIGVRSTPGEGSTFWFSLPAGGTVKEPPTGSAC